MDANRPPDPADLLHLEPRLGFDYRTVAEVLQLAYMGRETGFQLDHAVAELPPAEGWEEELFASDLFVDDLIADCFELEIDGRRQPVNRAFLHRVLCRPPRRPGEITFRQEILRELDDDPEQLGRVEDLYRELSKLVSVYKAPSLGARNDLTTFRLDLLRMIPPLFERLEESFADARSGLRRMHGAARAARASEPYRLLAEFLRYEGEWATVELEVGVGADGKIRQLDVRRSRRDRKNPFFLSPLRRFWSWLRLGLGGHTFTHDDLIERALMRVMDEVMPLVVGLVQLFAQIELYLCVRAFRARAAEQGLEMSLAEIDDEAPFAVEGLFNPLLLAKPRPVVAADLAIDRRSAITLVTGPNSGGKTRLLQAIGLAQLLGQSGFYTTAARARLPRVRGLCVSLIEAELSGSDEGRLGRELGRIRLLFERLEPGSMVILDELCSGTNPSEGAEVFELVLRLLQRLRPLAFVSTHFLDFARDLERRQTIPDLELRQATVDATVQPTYQFVDGVATTSLAAITARRLGVTEEELTELVDRRLGEKTPVPDPAVLAGTPRRG